MWNKKFNQMTDLVECWLVYLSIKLSCLIYINTEHKTSMPYRYIYIQLYIQYIFFILVVLQFTIQKTHIITRSNTSVNLFTIILLFVLIIIYNIIIFCKCTFISPHITRWCLYFCSIVWNLTRPITLLIIIFVLIS